MHSIRSIALFASLTLLAGSPAALPAQEGGDGALTVMLSGNDGLRAQGMDYMIQQIDFFNRDGSRSSARFFQQDFRWVPGDARRGSSDAGLTFLFDGAGHDGSSDGVSAAALTSALDRALATWGREACLEGVPLTEVLHDGGDVTVFDGLVGDGEIGDPFAADVVVAGFPSGMADFFGPDTLAFSVSFIFVDGTGEPTDVNGDRHLDTALNEIYLNPAFDWTLRADGAGFDLETALLHEVGHALGLGHFSPPPESVMSPVYSGVERLLRSIDRAALCVVYGRE